ncbi:DUF6924 domain-containing protein [Streptomyces sp. AA1529]
MAAAGRVVVVVEPLRLAPVPPEEKSSSRVWLRHCPLRAKEIPDVSESWSLAQSEWFCVTFSRGRTQEEVIEIYGARRGAGQVSPLDEEGDVIGGAGESGHRLDEVLVGKLGDWAFAVEFDSPIGCLDGILAPLSKATETILLFLNAKGLSGFVYIVDGRVVESFEPGNDSGNRGTSERDFFGEVLGLTVAGCRGVEAALTVIANYIGNPLTQEMLRGALSTAVVPVDDRRTLEHADPPIEYPPLADPPPSRPLGRYLGPLFPAEDPRVVEQSRQRAAVRLEQARGGGAGMRPVIGDHDAEAALVVRTSYEDESSWRAIVAELRQPWGEDDEHEARVHLVDDPAWSGATTGEVRAAVRAATPAGHVFVVDSTAVRHSHFAMLAVDLDPDAHPARDATEGSASAEDAFRLEPAAVGDVHMLLSLGEMGFDEYVERADRDPDKVYWSPF